MKTKRNRATGRRSRRLCTRDLSAVWTERVVCRVCGGSWWHVEIAGDWERDGYVPPCPDCGGPCLRVLDVLGES